MQINFTLFVLILLSFTSCAQEKESRNTTKFSKFPKEIVPSLVKVIDFEPKLPRQLLVNDSSLFVTSFDRNTVYNIYEYSLMDYKLVAKHFKLGSDVGELLSTRNSGLIDNYIYAHNNMDRKLVLKNLKDNHVIEYHSLPHLFSISLLDTNRLLGSGGDSSQFKIREFLLPDLQFIKGLGDYKPVPKRQPYNAWFQANTGFMLHNKNKNISVVASFHMDKVEFLNHQTGNTHFVHGPIGYEVEFDTYIRPNGKSISVDNKKTKSAYSNPGLSTDEFIYLPYAGIGYDSPDIALSGFRYLHIFDWSGNPVARVLFPHVVSGIAVDKNNKTIYVSDPVKNEILKFDLTL